ncbi:MAG: ATP-binding protein [Defluviitaleaceae bacterium]|nr:ATP-binding protein [Defluviitaleaceae bacterium]
MANKVFDEVYREFERRQLNAAYLRERRQDEVYAKSERLREIDREIAAQGPRLTYAVLSNTKNIREITAQMAEISRKLNEEKDKILTKLNIPPNYLWDVYKCGLCKDTGRVDNGERCACFCAALSAGYYKYSGMAKILERENFGTFDIGIFDDETDSKTGVSPKKMMARNVKLAQDFADGVGRDFNNLYMHGSTGTGKTFLCSCIAKHVLDAGLSVLYTPCTDLFKLVETVRFDRERDQTAMDEKRALLDQLIKVDLLIIDDLGTEVSTIITSSELYNILNSRLTAQLSTVISTNLNMKEITDIYSDRITSRILGNYTIMPFTGDDIRIKSRYGG